MKEKFGPFTSSYNFLVVIEELISCTCSMWFHLDDVPIVAQQTAKQRKINAIGNISPFQHGPGHPTIVSALQRHVNSQGGACDQPDSQQQNKTFEQERGMWWWLV
jgi:hypothetical protein